jgi:two-component system OmpR family sensor kinase
VSYFTVAAVSGGGHYRVRSSIEQGQPDYVLLIATPLTGAEGTLHRLFLIELVVTGAVLAVLAGLALWLVGLGLRPLVAMGETAKAITQGDLSRRVEQVDEKTEIGRLGVLLNTMLSQIEAAFQAREASETKLRRFVADASHELRTPVTAIRAYAELFSRGAAERPEDIERSMQGVRLASERMSALVDDLFLLAHLDEGRPLAQEAVDLDAVVADAVEFAQGLDPDRPVTVETRETIVIGDRSRLRQLVDNLLANVRAHTPPPAPVRVRLAHAGERAVLSVSDSGPGIDEESLPHVFERFYRSEVSLARAQGGSGLGLAIVQALAEAHGGTAAVSSRPGRGATFTITLPLAPIEAAPAAPPADGEDRAPEAAPEPNPTRP